MPTACARSPPHGWAIGGGLAGLSLAIQLKRQRPETSVLVSDKRAEPAPDAAFKVGDNLLIEDKTALVQAGQGAALTFDGSGAIRVPLPSSGGTELPLPRKKQ